MEGIMLDIETMGTRPSSAILSIGAVEFNAAKISNPFSVRISLQSCLDVGLTVDASTINWWIEQSAEARNKLLNTNPIPLAEALLALNAAFLWKDKLVWCNGLNFDLPILEHAYYVTGKHVPWKYYNGRDYRTIKGLFPKELIRSLEVKPAVAHDALEDAAAQAKTLQALWTVWSNGHP